MAAALMWGQVAGAVLAAAVAVVGLIIVPDGASIPIHAGFNGFDGFASRTRGLVTLAVLPVITGGVFLTFYLAGQEVGAIAGVVGIIAMLVLLIFNVQAVRYGMSAGS